MKYLYNIIYLLILISGCLFSQNTVDEILISSEQPGYNESAPFMQLGNDGTIYISWIRFTSVTGGDIYFVSSLDNGVTFSPPTKITENGNVNANYQRAGRFVIDKSDVLHIVWMEAKINNQTDIWYSQSADKGMSWTPQKSLMDLDDSLKYTQDFCDIAVDSSNNLYVSFLDARLYQRRISNNIQVYLTKSTDAGATWSNNVKVNDMPLNEGGSCECCSQSIEVSPEGNVYIAFRTNIEDRRDIFLARSFDRGNTFEKSFPIQNSEWTILACPVTGPRIALDSLENLHCVWFDDRDDSPPAVYYALLPFGNTQTPENIRLSKNSYMSPNYPDVSVSNGGKIAIAYQTYNQNTRFYFDYAPSMNYTDESISNNNTEKKFINVIAKDNNELFFCWQDTRRDAGDIYFKTILFNTSDIIEIPSGNITDEIYMKFFSQGKYEIRIFDILGNLKFQRNAIGNKENIFLEEILQSIPDIVTGIYVINYSNDLNNYSKLISFVK